jgi:hypothetical protein
VEQSDGQWVALSSGARFILGAITPVRLVHGGTHRMQLASKAVFCARRSDLGLTRVTRDRGVHWNGQGRRGRVGYSRCSIVPRDGVVD